MLQNTTIENTYIKGKVKQEGDSGIKEKSEFAFLCVPWNCIVYVLPYKAQKKEVSVPFLMCSEER